MSQEVQLGVTTALLLSLLESLFHKRQAEKRTATSYSVLTFPRGRGKCIKSQKSNVSTKSVTAIPIPFFQLSDLSLHFKINRLVFVFFFLEQF